MSTHILTDIPPHPVLYRKQPTVPISSLILNEKQVHQIKSIYQDKKEYLAEYNTNSQHQQEALQVLKDLLLDRQSRESLDSRWTRRWSTTSKGKDKWQRILYQWYVRSNSRRRRETRLTVISKCGYDERVRQKRDAPTNAGERQVPYDFTECMAHVEVSEFVVSGIVRRISGILEHNEKCASS